MCYIVFTFQLNGGAERPSTMCYICYQQLKRCRMFSETAHRAERILQVLAQGTRVCIIIFFASIDRSNLIIVS